MSYTGHGGSSARSSPLPRCLVAALRLSPPSAELPEGLGSSKGLGPSHTRDTVFRKCMSDPSLMFSRQSRDDVLSPFRFSQLSKKTTKDKKHMLRSLVLVCLLLFLVEGAHGAERGDDPGADQREDEGRPPPRMIANRRRRSPSRSG